MSWERAGHLAWVAPPMTVAFLVAHYVIAVYPEGGDEVDWLFCFVGLFFSGADARRLRNRPAQVSLWLRSSR